MGESLQSVIMVPYGKSGDGAMRRVFGELKERHEDRVSGGDKFCAEDPRRDFSKRSGK